MSGGWIRLHRKLADRPIWTQEKFTKGQAWVDLILQASYQDHVEIQGNSFLTVKRGQLFTSQALLSKRWRWNRETVRLFLRLLRDLNMVAIRTAKETETGYTLITLLNYDLYQGDSTDAKALPPAVDSAIRPPSDPPLSRREEGEERKRTPRLRRGGLLEEVFHPGTRTHPPDRRGYCLYQEARLGCQVRYPGGDAVVGPAGSSQGHPGDADLPPEGLRGSGQGGEVPARHHSELRRGRSQDASGPEAESQPRCGSYQASGSEHD